MVGRRKGAQSITPLEMQVLQVLWREGDCSVQQVQAGLNAAGGSVASLPGLAYTTVQTVLNSLHTKGKVKRAMDGRAFRYRAVLSREKALGTAVRDLVTRMFGGSHEELVMSLIKSRQVDPGRIAVLSAALTTEPEKDGGAE